MIIKYYEFNESIKNLLTGPTKEEIISSKDGVDNILKQGIEENDFDLVKFSIENGADVHIITDLPLRHASYEGYYDIVEYLLDNGANINTTNGYPLRYSTQYNHYDIVKLLLERGANVHADYDGALRMAVDKNNLKIAKLLLDNGADINSVWTELNISQLKSNNQLEMIELLSKYIKTNESIKSLLVGPSKEEVWKQFNGKLYFEESPDTKEDFMDKLFELLEKKEFKDGVEYNYNGVTQITFYNNEFQKLYSLDYDLFINSNITLLMGTVYDETNIKDLKLFYENYLSDKFYKNGDKQKYKMRVDISLEDIYNVFRKNNLI